MTADPTQLDASLDRVYLVADVIDRVPGLSANPAGLRQHTLDEPLRCRRNAYTDGPDVADWTWQA
jgi:xylulose-5-phosphate/fructose-6-phosphate phosphoketolase